MEAEPNLLKGDKIKIFLIGKPHPDVNPLVLPLCLGKSPLTQFPISAFSPTLMNEKEKQIQILMTRKIGQI